MYRIAKKKLNHMFWSDDLPDDVIAQMLRLFGIGPIEVSGKVNGDFLLVKFPNGELGSVPMKMLKPIELKHSGPNCSCPSDS